MSIPEPYKSLIRSRYNFLKQKGLEKIRSLSNKDWTDYNLHDPGITILEQLCYAIIDLEYRSSFLIEDILAEDPNDTNLKNKKLPYCAEEILPSNPWSKKDFIKLILDVPGIKNVQICISDLENEVKGGYKIFLVQEDDEIRKDTTETTLINNVVKTLYKHRNLCEDFFEVSILKPKPFFIKADLEIKYSITPERGAYIVAKLLFDIQNFLVPFINFYTLSDMIYKKMHTVEEIYSGPLLNHGFIDDAELDDSAIKLQFHVSELADKIVVDNDIRSLLSLYVYTSDNSNANNYIQVQMGEVFKLDVSKSCINLYRNGLPITIQSDRIAQLYKELNMMRFIKKKSFVDEEIAYSIGNYRDLSKYYSIQNDFPLVYGVGIEGPHKKADTHTKSRVNQMKAFLLIFDQIFANHLAKLHNSKFFLPIYKPKSADYLTQVPSSVPYLNQIIKNLSNNGSYKDNEFMIQRKLLGIEIKNSDREIHADNPMTSYYNYLQAISAINDYHRNQINRTLDFTLSMVAENLPENIVRIGLTSEEDIMSKTLDFKLFLIQGYIEAIRNANKSINILTAKNSPFAKEDASGFEYRICKYLNIKNIGKRDFCKVYRNIFHIAYNIEKSTIESILINAPLSNKENLIFFESNLTNSNNLIIRYGCDVINYEITEISSSEYIIELYIERESNTLIKLIQESKIESLKQAENIVKLTTKFFKKFSADSEGFYTVEHILLRSDNVLSGDKDPYSFTVTVALPAWPARFQIKDFRDQFYKTVLEHSPAHVLVNILWLDIDEMEAFEKAYDNWIMLKTNSNADKDSLKKASQNLLGIILMYSNDSRE